jgi:uncharacterized membrane protein (UPF0127 family)
MQKVKDAKTEWALKAIIVAVALIFATLYVIFYHGKTELKTPNTTYNLEVVTSEAQLEKGLGDRNALGTDDGMLFIFNKPAVECIWMKDMRFPLDIVWLSTSKQVLHIESNVSQNTYPKTYCPDVNAQYVIELNAGQAKRAGINLGETLSF